MSFSFFLLAKIFFMSFISNMDISFKGIKNPTLLAIKGQSSSGLIKMKAYRFAATLTNDAKGKHFDDFYKALDKLDGEGAWKYLPLNSPPEQVIFDVSKFRFDNTDIQPEATFMLNGRNLPLDNDKVLPIFSFLAKTISTVQNSLKNTDVSNNAHKINEIIEEAVINYLG